MVFRFIELISRNNKDKKAIPHQKGSYAKLGTELQLFNTTIILVN